MVTQLDQMPNSLPKQYLSSCCQDWLKSYNKDENDQDIVVCGKCGKVV